MAGSLKCLNLVAFNASLAAVTLLSMIGIAEPVAAQSIRIQSWNSQGFFPFGGISIGIPLGSNGYHSYHHHYGLPSLSSPYAYDVYRYQNDYHDYRNDYNQRLYDAYRRDLQRDLYYSHPGLDFGGVAPYGLDLYSPFDNSRYYPPVAQIEPFSGNEYRIPQLYGDGQPTAPAKNLPEALRAAATRLSISLSRRGNDGDVWLDYLSPGRIIAAIDQGLSVDNASGLLQNFDGIIANPELRSIAASDGFEDTRRLLGQWIEMATVAQPEPSAAPELVPGANSNDVPDDATSDEPIEAVPASQRTSV